MHDTGSEKLLCGNKIDLKLKRKVNFDELEEWIKIDDAFQKIIDIILINKQIRKSLKNLE